MRKCLLIKTQDKRHLLIRKRSMKWLAEFAKTFRVKIFFVELPDRKEKILDSDEFKIAFCDPTFDSHAKFNILETVWPKSKRSRKDILSEAKKIHQFIRKRMLDGKAVSLRELKQKYSDQKVTDACLCNHFSKIRKELADEGHAVEKTGAGTYCLT